jgi:hypothetical protein
MIGTFGDTRQKVEYLLNSLSWCCEIVKKQKDIN